MSSDFSKSSLKNTNVLDLYIQFSFLSSIILWVGFFYTTHNFFSTGFYVSGLALGNYYFFSRGQGHYLSFKNSAICPGYFLFQSFMLIGMGFTYHQVGPLYLCLIPCVAGTYFLQSVQQKKYTQIGGQSFALFFITFCLYLFFVSVTNHKIVTEQNLFVILSFISWTIGLAYCTGSIFHQQTRSFLFSLLGQKEKGNKYFGLKRSEEQKERFFFHDLINQTHGVSLFLNDKINTGEGMNHAQCKDVFNEIKVMQSLIKDHFGQNHKNLINTYDIVTFEEAKKGLQHLIATFLPPHSTRSHLVYHGWIKESASAEARDKALVHYPTLYRILNNLVKNIAEDNVQEIEIVFDYGEDGFNMVIKNKIFFLKEKVNLAKNLSDIILKGESTKLTPDRGTGLESVATMCEVNGGSFHFSIEGEYWVNKIFLPNPTSQQSIQAKKAA